MSEIKGRRRRAAARVIRENKGTDEAGQEVSHVTPEEISPEQLVEGLQDGSVRIVEFCIGETADGRDYWAFVSFEAEKYAQYAEAVLQNQTINLPALGEILLTGWGHEPPAEDLEWLKENYGIEKPDMSKSDAELAEEALTMLEEAAKKLEEEAAKLPPQA